MTQQLYSPGSADPRRSFIATWLLSLLLGLLGVDRFYLGKVGTGLLKLVTFGGLGLWWTIDLIITLAGGQRDKQGRDLAGYAQHRTIAWVVSIVFVLVGGFSSLPSLVG